MSVCELLDVAACDVEEFIVVCCIAENLVQMVAVCVGYEDLSEGVFCHQADDLFNSLRVQLVEDVIEQKDGERMATGVLQK